MKYFGTDGFRGVAGTDLTVEHAYKIGRFIGGRWRTPGPQGSYRCGQRYPSLQLHAGKRHGFWPRCLRCHAYMLHVIQHLAFRTKLPMARSIAV